MARLGLADGAHLEYELAGDGPTVTLIHPGLWDMKTWDREVRRFPQAGYRVLRYDVRGYGRSSRPDPGEPYSHVRDLLELLDAIEVTQTALVGCSMGGGIALDFALEHPERVWALVPVASGLGGFESTESEDEWWAQRDEPIEAAIEAGDLERAQALRLEMWAPLGTSDERGARIREIAFDNLHEITLDESGEERLDPPAAHRLAEIDMPILILEAEHDPPDMRRTANFLAMEIMGSRKVVVEGADHVVNLRQPERFDELVLPFLAEAAPR
ncbi:MAG TPA: alpha/beta hydrolase [Actinomycetota bacterium]|nr:alpha/beta hydrolase [Actinomycetota bacterium]